VTRLIVTEEALADVERLASFLLETMPHEAAKTADIVLHGLQLLASHPLIGRPAPEGLRELVISRGRSGYLALYDYDEETDSAVVHAIRHQRESGYRD